MRDSLNLQSEMVQEASLSESSQRVQVHLQLHPQGKRVKIRLESYDDGLGWYTSGSLVIPIHQLPLVEQAIEEMRLTVADENYAEIIPFPGTITEQSA